MSRRKNWPVVCRRIENPLPLFDGIVGNCRKLDGIVVLVLPKDGDCFPFEVDIVPVNPTSTVFIGVTDDFGSSSTAEGQYID